MYPKGKGLFLWKINRVLNGEPARIAEAAQNARLSHLLIKIADGKYNYNIYNGTDLVAPLVAELRARGIKPWGWQYVYGSSPRDEAEKGIARFKQFELDGFVVDAETQFKYSGMGKVAKNYMERLRAGLPNVSIGLSTYRYPSVHAPFPFDVFLRYVDFVMPQVYWVEASNPAEQLRKSMAEYKALAPKLPVIPTGSAYAHGSWRPTPDQIQAFLQEARAQGLHAANFWEFYESREPNKELWKSITNFDWGGPTPPSSDDVLPEPAPQPQPITELPPGFTADDLDPNTQTIPTPAPAPPPPTNSGSPVATNIVTRYLRAQNQGLPNKVTQLYEKNQSRLVNGGQSYKGRMGIYGYHNQMLTRRMPGARFTLTGLQQKGDVIYMSWSAKSKDYKVNNGSDQFRMSVDEPSLINHHKTSYTIKRY